jgi:rod shape-determining protein MreD
MALKSLASLLLLALSVVLTTTVFSQLALPGATPDAVLVTVVAIGLAGGVRWGAAAGFTGGLLMDLAPPAVVPIGSTAFVMCVVGAACGFWGLRPMRGVTTTLLLVAGSAILAQGLRALLGLMVRDGRVDIASTPELAITGALYAVVLAPFVIPIVAAMFRLLRAPGEPSGLSPVLSAGSGRRRT